MEALLVPILKLATSRVFPDAAPVNTPRPYIVYQAVGGTPLRYIDNAAADKRHTQVQIDVYADTRLAASALVHQIENDLCAAATLTATPANEATTTAIDLENDSRVYGSSQDFDIWSAR